MSAPLVLFVTEGGAEVGLGHVTRCLAIARAAAAEGARAAFLTTPDPRLTALLDGIPATVLSRQWPDDPTAAIATAGELAPDAIVVDSYKATADFLAALRRVAPPVVAVDDVADRALPVDVVVNGGVAAESLAYRRDGDAIFLLGARYALLDPAYADLPERPVPAAVTRVLITLGGGRNTASLAAAVGAADAVLTEATLDVVPGPFAGSGDVDAIRRAATRNRLTLHADRLGLRDLILGADVAVCGAGMTLYELSAAGTPAVTVCMAENQRPNAEAFARAGVAPMAGWGGDPGLGAAIAAALESLVAERDVRAEAAVRARRLVDGRGAIRVARHALEPARARR